MSKLYDNVNNPLCIKGCDTTRLTALSSIWNEEGGDYYKFTFQVLSENYREQKDTSELIDCLNKTPTKEFFIIDFGRYWSIYLHQDDAVLWRIKWGGEIE